MSELNNRNSLFFSPSVREGQGNNQRHLYDLTFCCFDPHLSHFRENNVTFMTHTVSQPFTNHHLHEYIHNFYLTLLSAVFLYFTYTSSTLACMPLSVKCSHIMNSIK